MRATILALLLTLATPILSADTAAASMTSGGQMGQFPTLLSASLTQNSGSAMSLTETARDSTSTTSGASASMTESARTMSTSGGEGRTSSTETARSTASGTMGMIPGSATGSVEAGGSAGVGSATMAGSSATAGASSGAAAAAAAIGGVGRGVLAVGVGAVAWAL